MIIQSVHKTSMLAVALLLFCGVTATVYADSLVPFWKVQAPEDLPVTGITLADDGSRILVHGNQLSVFSRGGERLYGGYAGSVAAMSGDGNYVVSALGQNVRLIDKDGAEVWTKTMKAPVSHVAISKSASVTVAADTDGDISSWYLSGGSNGTMTIEPSKNMALSPAADMIVVATDKGLRFVNPGLFLMWTDNRTDSIDRYIAFTSDGSTIYTAGGKRVSSHAKDGTLNWQRMVTTADITSLACSGDGRTVVVGCQDGKVYALDMRGIAHTEYKTGGWVNAIGLSQDGTLIAAGSVDRSLTLLTRNGEVQRILKTTSIIQPRSIVISNDKSYLVYADQSTINAYYIEPEVFIADETATPRPTTFRTTPATTAVPAMTTIETVVTEIPVQTTATQKSPVSLVTVAGAVAAVLALMRRHGDGR